MKHQENLENKYFKNLSFSEVFSIYIENTYKMKKTIRLTESDLYEIIKESVSNILSESKGIKSKKLYDISQTHGGIESNRGIFDIHNLNDNDVIGVVKYSEWRNIVANGIKNFAQKHNIELGISDTLDVIPLKDGNYVICKLRGGHYDMIGKKPNAERERQNGDFENLVKKKLEREYNRYPRRGDYVWNNKDAEELFHNPYFRKGEGNWTPERKLQAMNNIRSSKKWFDN